MFDDWDDPLESNIQALMDLEVGAEGVEAGLGEASYLVEESDGDGEDFEEADDEEW